MNSDQFERARKVARLPETPVMVSDDLIRALALVLDGFKLPQRELLEVRSLHVQLSVARFQHENGIVPKAVAS